jgi:hypothetical protein
VLLCSTLLLQHSLKKNDLSFIYSGRLQNLLRVFMMSLWDCISKNPFR